MSQFDTITVLTAYKLTAKQWEEDGGITAYDKAKNFDVQEVQIGDVRQLSKLLTQLEPKSSKCIIRGKFVGFEEAAKREQLEIPNKTYRRKTLFEDQPLHATLIEVDGYESLCDPIEAPESAVEEYIACELPAEFHNVSYHWQLSNSAGHITKPGLKAHIWFWLSNPMTSAALRSWAKAIDLKADHSVMDTIQIHYTAAPIFAPGVVDPVSKRSGFHQGDAGNAVLISETQIAKIESRIAVSYSDDIEKKIEADPFATHLANNGYVIGVGPEGRLWIRCPNEDAHTSDSGPSSTSYMLPHYRGVPVGVLKCLHDHCSGVSQEQFRELAGFTNSLIDDFHEIAPSDPNAPQKLSLRVTKAGPIADEENVRRVLILDERLHGIARFDEFRSERVLSRPIHDDQNVVSERGIPRPWTDADTVAVQTYLQRRYFPKIGRERIEGVLDLYARQNCGFHPVRDYLQGLTWDGVPRLDTWLTVHLGADQQPVEYLAAVGAKFLISAVARIFEPGCQVDSAMVLEGRQGLRKSTALRVLAGDAYFSDSLPADLAQKDAKDHLRGKWIIELSELAQFKRGEIETIKSFITRRHESYRPSYGRHEITFPRQCVFAGTTNAHEYLIDTTGNRRFWVVVCGSVNLDLLAADRDQLWAEAVARYREGEQWFLTGLIADVAAEEAQARISFDPWTAEVSRILDGDTEFTPPNDISPGEVMQHMSLPQGERHGRNAARIGQILRDLGWVKGRRDRTRGQIYERAKTCTEA